MEDIQKTLHGIMEDANAGKDFGLLFVWIVAVQSDIVVRYLIVIIQYGKVGGYANEKVETYRSIL